jgi:predicted aspartyl protease
MLLNKKILLIILVAFSLGFAASEYRTRYLTQHISERTVDIGHTAAIKSVAVKSEYILKKKAVDIQVAQPEESLVEAFSWVQVDQLIAGAHYDDAIRLLQEHMGDAKDTARVWLLLASIYKKQSQSKAAVDALFRYLRLEMDVQKIEKSLSDIQGYLLLIKEKPALFNDDYSWLIAQFEELLKYRSNDGELHLILASLLLQLNDNYQAQYHALMAANDPAAHENAEMILAKLNGNNTPDEISIPLTRLGNQYLISASVEGYPVRFLLDTGASLSGLASAYTTKYPDLLKAMKPIRLNTASGIRDTFLFTVNDIKIGDLIFNQHILAQLPMDNSLGFDGLLGVDILGRFDFVIDQDASVLRLKVRKP